MLRLAHTLPLVILMILGGCGTTRGARETVTSTGPVVSTGTAGLVGRFINAHKDSQATTGDSTKALAYLNAGMELIRSNCTDFFESAGSSQTLVGVSRDAVVTVGTIGSAVLALHSGSRIAAGNLALFTGIANSGLDIYTKNFLFSAENVDSVKKLIVDKALAEHHKAVLSLAPFTYESATGHLLDNQYNCTMAPIAALARNAIKNGIVTPAISGAGIAPLVDAADAAVLQRLGTLLNPPGPISMEQATALWWLLKEQSDLNEKKFGISPNLEGLPAAAQPLDANGALQAGWPEAAVRRELELFSELTRERFRKAIEELRPTAAAAATAPAGGAPLNPNNLKLRMTGARANQGARVTVDVR